VKQYLSPFEPGSKVLVHYMLGLLEREGPFDGVASLYPGTITPSSLHVTETRLSSGSMARLAQCRQRESP